MENNNKGFNSSGIGFVGLLTIVFIVLKLTNVISWSWLWVLSPIWISIVLFIITVVIVFLILKIRENKKKR